MLQDFFVYLLGPSLSLFLAFGLLVAGLAYTVGRIVIYLEYQKHISEVKQRKAWYEQNTREAREESARRQNH